MVGVEVVLEEPEYKTFVADLVVGEVEMRSSFVHRMDKLEGSVASSRIGGSLVQAGVTSMIPTRLHSLFGP